MPLPELDLASLPDLADAPAVYGSRSGIIAQPGHGGRDIIAVMVYLYDSISRK